MARSVGTQTIRGCQVMEGQNAVETIQIEFWFLIFRRSIENFETISNARSHCLRGYRLREKTQKNVSRVYSVGYGSLYSGGLRVSTRVTWPNSLGLVSWHTRVSRPKSLRLVPGTVSCVCSVESKVRTLGVPEYLPAYHDQNYYCRFGTLVYLSIMAKLTRFGTRIVFKGVFSRVQSMYSGGNRVSTWVSWPNSRFGSRVYPSITTEIVRFGTR